MFPDRHLDIVDSKDEVDRRSGFGEERYVVWERLAARLGAASQRAYSAAIVRGLELRPSAFPTPPP
jgi:hypothetical protein